MIYTHEAYNITIVHIFFPQEVLYQTTVTFEPGETKAYITAILPMYLVKIFNQMDDFVYANLTVPSMPFWYGKYLAPDESVEYALFIGYYRLYVTYPNGTTECISFTVTEDMTIMINGFTITQVIGLLSKTVIGFYDQLGNYLPFERFRVYYVITDEPETPSPAAFQPLLDNEIFMRPDQYLHIKVYDRWNWTLLVKYNINYQRYLAFTITVYTFKIVSFQSDFVLLQLRRNESSYWYQEWIAPNEIRTYYLGPGYYYLMLSFRDGQTISEGFKLDTHLTYVIAGWTIEKLAGRIDLEFTRFLPISVKSVWTGEEIPLSSLDIRINGCLLYTSPSPRDLSTSRMPSSA